MKKFILPLAIAAISFASCSETTKTDTTTANTDTAVLEPNGNPTAADLVDSAGNKMGDAAEHVDGDSTIHTDHN